ncbi:MAG TPA: transposase DNA-binding-containing protein [Armatimonadota bacterium]|nr:transposase DNA-binding-containing protein [Armatimonadota bacterium]
MEEWAMREFAGARLYDQRRNKSLAQISEPIYSRPEESFSRVVGSKGRQAIWRMSRDEEVTIKDLQSAGEVVSAISQLGGFVTYAGGPPPDLKSLWIGLRRLHAMVGGWRLARLQLPADLCNKITQLGMVIQTCKFTHLQTHAPATLLKIGLP